jgi:hypothetical protein
MTGRKVGRDLERLAGWTFMFKTVASQNLTSVDL